LSSAGWVVTCGFVVCPLSRLVMACHWSPRFDGSRPLAPPGSWLVLGQGLGHAGDPDAFESLGSARVDAAEQPGVRNYSAKPTSAPRSSQSSA
jgi:hypothetical protein